MFLEQCVIGFYQPDYDNYCPCEDLKTMSRQIKLSKVDSSKQKTVLTRTFAITNRMELGDYVMVPSKVDHLLIHLGRVKGDCIYNLQSELTFSRDVKWLGELKRLEIDKKSLHSMGSLTTVFKVRCDNSLIQLFQQLESQRE